MIMVNVQGKKGASRITKVIVGVRLVYFIVVIDIVDAKSVHTSDPACINDVTSTTPNHERLGMFWTGLPTASPCIHSETAHAYS